MYVVPAMWASSHLSPQARFQSGRGPPWFAWKWTADPTAEERQVSGEPARHQSRDSVVLVMPARAGIDRPGCYVNRGSDRSPSVCERGQSKPLARTTPCTCGRAAFFPLVGLGLSGPVVFASFHACRSSMSSFCERAALGNRGYIQGHHCNVLVCDRFRGCPQSYRAQTVHLPEDIMDSAAPSPPLTHPRLSSPPPSLHHSPPQLRAPRRSSSIR